MLAGGYSATTEDVAWNDLTLICRLEPYESVRLTTAVADEGPNKAFVIPDI